MKKDMCQLKKVRKYFICLEILEYAKYIGMDPKEDQDLMDIARQGICAPLPEPWKPCQTGKGEIYYFNFKTGESMWEHPCDQQYKQLYKDEKAKKMKKQGNVKEEEEKFPKEIEALKYVF